MDIQKLTEHAWLGISAVTIDEATQKYLEMTRHFSKLESVPQQKLNRCFETQVQISNAPALFGTSGIRGIFDQTITGNPVDQFVQNNKITSKFSYYFGRAAGLVLAEQRFTDPVWVCMDPRQSGLIMSMALMCGLKDEGIDVSFGGVSPTPLYTLNPKGMTIVITASHNPIHYNGIKAFWQGRPLIVKLEQRVENYIRAFAELEKANLKVEASKNPGSVSVNVLEFDRRHFKALFNSVETAKLRLEYGVKLANSFLPLDLAYGAAACCIDDTGSLSRLSVPLALFLSLDIPIVGYGCVRDAFKMNTKIGAAYAYDETPDTPEPGEIAKFARGFSGYGSGAQRIVFLPLNFLSANEKLTRLVDKADGSAYLQRIPVGFPEFTSDITVIFLDHHEIDEHIATEIEAELMKRKPLPGLMVDGDADRILVTACGLSKQETPFLTGDTMIRLFAALSCNNEFREIVFTVESGISLEKALQLNRQQLLSNQEDAFNIQTVTVGDRAIIDYFLDRGIGSMLGGEPSGHIIFAQKQNDELRIIDDPFMTYIKMLALISFDRFDLDRVVDRLLTQIPDVYCARKPDARTAHGISLEEKRQLELWNSNDISRISKYAHDFIPAYIEMFGMAYSQAFLNCADQEMSFSLEWERLLEGSLSTQDWNGDLPVGLLAFGASELLEELNIGLHIDRRRWAGPDVIRLSFTLDTDQSGPVKMGEGVFRNSGTSPKNAGYNKLWPVHPLSGGSITDGRLREILDDLASRRATWTERYVMSTLRKESHI